MPDNTNLKRKNEGLDQRRLKRVLEFILSLESIAAVARISALASELALPHCDGYPCQPLELLQR